MQIFLFLNDLAGRWPFLDQLARFFYVSAVPLSATLWLALLLLSPRPADSQTHSQADAKASWRALAAVGVSLGLLALLGWGLELGAQALGLGTLSPRPFMTRRVNLLVVEPQDNSFPCYEVAISAIFAVATAFLNRKCGLVAALLTLMLGATRLFCGTDYFADVAVAALIGTALAAGCGAAFGLRWNFLAARPLAQPLGAATLLLLTLGGTYAALAQTPRFASKLPAFWGSPVVSAPPSEMEAASSAATTRAARTVQEGEGVAPENSSENAPLSAEELALSKRSHLFLPAVEKFLRGQLTPLARPFRLLDVEVAPVKAGGTSWRAAALRFEITRGAPDLRRATAEVAARLVKGAFAHDSQLQNVDVTAILRGDATEIAGSTVRFAGDEVPVFTASIARQNLVVAAPRWANAPKLDGGSWLRTRSRLYINDRVLPATPQQRAERLPALATTVPRQLRLAPTPAPAAKSPVSPAATNAPKASLPKSSLPFGKPLATAP